MQIIPGAGSKQYCSKISNWKFPIGKWQFPIGWEIFELFNSQFLRTVADDTGPLEVHPITNMPLEDGVPFGEDDAELFSESAPPSTNSKPTMLTSLLSASGSNELSHNVKPFDEWDSLPAKYLVSDSKSYLAYFKVRSMSLR